MDFYAGFMSGIVFAILALIMIANADVIGERLRT